MNVPSSCVLAEKPVTPIISNLDFVKAVFGASWDRAHVCGFDCDPDKAGPRWFGGVWSETGASLRPAENNYFTISTFSGGRRVKDQFVATHAIVVDDVGTKVRSEDVLAKMPSPSWSLETSPGNFQWGYVLAEPETDAGRVNALIDGMIAAGLCAVDPGMKGVTRYMRLPVGRNTKAKYGPGGFSHVLHEWRPEKKFTMDDLAAPWGIELPAPGSVRPCGEFSGDAAGDELFRLLDEWGMIEPGRASDGVGYRVECPWIDDHTGRAPTGAAYYVGGGFKCHHGHCEGKGRREIAMWAHRRVSDESGGLAGFGPWAFDVVPGYVPPNAGARGKVIVPAAVGDVEVAVDFGTGTAAAFFSELVYVASEDRFFSLRTGEMLTRAAVDFAWTARLKAKGLLPAASPRSDEVMSPSRWFSDEGNTGRARLADRITYWPGAAPFFTDGGIVLVNKWAAPDRTRLPVQDTDVAEWLALVRHVVGSEDEHSVECMLDWMAMVVGEPSVKPGYHVVVQGGQGLGKDLIAGPMKAGVGEDHNVGTVNAAALHGAFNPWAEKRLVMVNELRQTSQGSSTGSDQYNVLKELTENTSKKLKINTKNVREYYARNVSAFFVTSNDEKAIALEKDDRRFLVVMSEAKPWPPERYAALANWMTKGGAMIGAEWLHKRWETMTADRKATLLGHAPMTRGKARMIANTEDPVTAWMRDQIETGTWPDLMTGDDISTAIATASKSGKAGFTYAVSPNKWAAILSKLGAAKVYRGAPVKLKSGQSSRVWAIRAPERFVGMGQAQIAQAYVSAAENAFMDAAETPSVVKIGTRKSETLQPLPAEGWGGS